MKNVWENPEVQQLNRLPMRSPLLPFDSPENAMAEVAAGPESVPQTKSPFVQNLDGTWKFTLLKTPLGDADSKLKNWTTASFADSAWSDIKVPGTWTLQGFDDYPHYTNVQMPFDTIPPNVPTDRNPTGLYRRTISLPASWKNRRVVLHIGSAESVVILYVNGEEVGVSKDTRLPCEFDITHWIDWSSGKGKAVIAIKVVRYSDASYVEDQDQWWLGGIHRSVYLYSTEGTFIQDVEALSYVDGSETARKFAENNSPLNKEAVRANEIPHHPQGLGAVEASVGIIPLVVTMGFSDTKNEITRRENKEMDTFKRVISYTVHKLGGTPQKGTVGAQVAHGTEVCVYNYRETINQFRTKIKIKNVKLWSAEHPELYLVTVSMYEPGANGKAGRHVESVSFTTGFKTVELKNRELLFNGKKVYIHGANRHEHNSETGKTLSIEQMVHEMFLLKTHNFNAVRTCHYPDDHRWYDLCDRYGIYILDEANIENHGYYDVIPRSDEWAGAYFTRISRMVRRDKNHACIYGWSLGNESGDGQNHVALGAWIRRVDPTRIVHYEGYNRMEIGRYPMHIEDLARGRGLTDIICPMYPPIKMICDYVDNYDDYRPLIMCEYSHAMGNANGSLADYWRAIESHHGLQGGFIWEWVDHGFKATAPKGKPGEPQGGDYWKYGGDFGDSPSDYDFIVDGLNFPDFTPHPAMEECKKVFAPVKLHAVHPKRGIFEVENKFDFTTLDALKLKWSLLKNGTVIKSAVMALPKAKPYEKVQIVLPISKDAAAASEDGSEIVLHADFVYAGKTAWAKAGDVRGYDEYVLYEAKGLTTIIESKAKAAAVGKTAESIVEKVKPVISRPLIQNECVKRMMPGRKAKEGDVSRKFANVPTNEWLDVGLLDAVVKVKNQTAKKTTFEMASGKTAIKNVDFGTMEYSTSKATAPDGSPAIKLDVTFNLSKKVSEYHRAGITFPVPAALTTTKWYGRGPHECYNDRKDSAMLGLYASDTRALEVPYVVPQENGNRCDTTYLEMSGKGADTLHIQSETPFVFSVSRFTPEDMWKAEHLSELTDLSVGTDAHFLVTIDAAHRGVGTGVCGPDTLEEYRVRPGTYKMTLIIW